MNKEKIKKDIIKVLKKENNFLITSHQSPDGDAIGSTLALGTALKNLGKKVILLSEKNMPSSSYYLPKIKNITYNLSKKNLSDFVIIALECSDLKRIPNNLGEKINSFKFTINIDHHLDNSNFGNLNLVDKKASAVAEIIYELLKMLKAKITKEIATSLYYAIITDTGNFKFYNTTSKTLKIASSLVKYGASAGEISEFSFNNIPLSKLQFIGYLLNQIKTEKEGKIAYISISKEMYKNKNGGNTTPSEILNFLNMLSELKVGILFKEEKKDKIRVSLRSRGKIDIRKIATKFSGGGHLNAAGCIIKDTLLNAENAIINEVKKIVK